MKMITAIIVDDESSSRGALKQKLASYCPEVSVVAECENGEEGITSIESAKPDLVFLDVEMPRMTGFTMLQLLKYRDFEVIFITAYDHYAIRAIKFSALDYLVKPVEVEDLKLAVLKAVQKRNQPAGNERLELLLDNLVNDRKGRQRLAIPSMEGLQFISLDIIVYLEAKSNYTVIHLNSNAKITVSKTLKDFEEMLPAANFVRIHHAYIINCDAVDKYIKGDGGQVLMQNGAMLDVSKRKKAEFLKAIGS